MKKILLFSVGFFIVLFCVDGVFSAKEKKDIVISGSGTIPGGSYKLVKISGYGKVDGDLSAEEFRVSGTAKVEGNILAKRVEVNGSLKSSGKFKSDEAEFSGSVEVEDEIFSNDVRISGSLHSKSFSGEIADCSGSIAVEENIKFDQFKISGSFKASKLSANTIEVKIWRNSRVKEMEGKRIDIRYEPVSTVKVLKMVLGGAVNADIIKGDDIYLEGVEAKLVRGRAVKIGKGSKVDKVEYSDSLEIKDDAKVGEKVKVNIL